MSKEPGALHLEQMTLMAFIAGCTSKLRVITGVMVLPLRNPLLVAKMISTLDVLSNGRVTVGCGVGWEAQEFKMIGAPPFSERGRVADEYIRLFKELWTSEAPYFEGDYVQFAEAPFLPKPVQKPHPPIWVGGESPPAIRRAAQLGDAWYPIGSNQKYPLDTPTRYGAAVEKLFHHTEEAGRDPSSIALAYNVLWYDESDARILPDGERRAFTGSNEQIAEDIRQFEAIGVSHIVLNLQAPSLEETIGRMERFTEEVMPLAT